MNGIDNLQPTVDEFAPLFHVRKDAPPLVLITGDRELELFGRYEETFLYEIGGHGHGPMGDPAFYILKQHIKRILGEPEK